MTKNLPAKNADVKSHQLTERCIVAAEETLSQVSSLVEALALRQLNEAMIDAAKSQLSEAEMVWAPVGRPATLEEVAVSFARLFACFPNAPKSASLEPLMDALVEDVLSERPTIYAVVVTCRWLRKNSKYVPVIAEVMKALRKANRCAADHQELVGAIPDLREELAEARLQLPQWRADRELEKATGTKAIRERAQAWPPEQFPGCYTDDDLTALGRTRDEVDAAFLRGLDQ